MEILAISQTLETIMRPESRKNQRGMFHTVLDDQLSMINKQNNKLWLFMVSGKVWKTFSNGKHLKS
jgi:hypothetical protein